MGVLFEPRHQEELQRLGIEIFNTSPGQGMAFLVAVGAVRDYPVEINNFLVRVGVNPKGFGTFLGEDHSIAQTLRLEFLNALPLLNTGALHALQLAFQEIAVPDDWAKTDRLVQGIAHFWWRQHEDSEGYQPQNYKRVNSHTEAAGVELQRCLQGSDAFAPAHVLDIDAP